jgi:hypothetical protein
MSFRLLADENVDHRVVHSISEVVDQSEIGQPFYVNDILPGVNAGVSSRWGYRLPTHGGNLRVRALLVGTRAW